MLVRLFNGPVSIPNFVPRMDVNDNFVIRNYADNESSARMTDQDMRDDHSDSN